MQTELHEVEVTARRLGCAAARMHRLSGAEDLASRDCDKASAGECKVQEMMGRRASC